MRLFLIFLTVVVCCSGAVDANAADLAPPYSPLAGPAAPSAPNWTGFYLGAQAGIAFDQTGGYSTNCGVACTSAAGDIRGAVGGFQAGYNYQLGPMVAGVEADVTRSTLRSSYPATDGIDAVTSSVDYSGSLTARFGVTMDRALLYAKGGVAWTRYAHSDYDTVEAESFSTRYWQLGGTVGAGIEYALLANWSVRLEYDAILTGTKPTTFTAASGDFFTANMRQFVSTVALGANYRF